MIKVAITGASGFIGGHLLQKLINKKNSIKVLDFGGGKYPKEVIAIKGDLLGGYGIQKFLEGSDVLVHLAGQVLPDGNSMDEGNLLTTKNLLAEVSKTKIKKVIFSSSVAVYGDSNGKVFKESDLCNPNTDYGKSKLLAEKVINDWSRSTGGMALIFRFFSIYGPGNKKGVVYNLCHDFIKNGEVSVFGSGHQKRDLVYVEDVAGLISSCLSSSLGGTYNVGSGKYYSILDLISILEEISGKKCDVNFKNNEKEKVNEIIYSVVKLKKTLEWSPKIDVKEGIKKVYNHLLGNEK